MTHLTDGQRLDAAEADPATARPAHLAGCRECATAVEDLRAAIDAVAGVPAPDPSPFFWDGFRSRVSEAIDAPPATPFWRAWPAGRLRWLSAAAAILVVSIIGFYASRTTIESPASPPAPVTLRTADAGSAAGFAADPALDASDDDEAWAVMRSLAAELHYEDLRDAGALPRPGAVERAATELSETERAELVRLIRDEMKRMGA